MNNSLLHQDCPQLMSDARFATDYRPSCVAHSQMINRHNLVNSNKMRAYLQRNAQSIIEANRRVFITQHDCPSGQYYHIDPNLQELYWNNYRSQLQHMK